MWLLTGSTPVERFAFTYIVARLQAIEAKVVVSQSRYHLVVRKRLELWANVQWMFDRTAKYTVGHRVSRVGREGGDRFGSMLRSMLTPR